MTRQETEQLARLTQQVKDMAKQLEQNTRDTAAIKSALDNITGGKQALMWMAGFLISALIAFSTWLGVHK